TRPPRSWPRAGHTSRSTTPPTSSPGSPRAWSSAGSPGERGRNPECPGPRCVGRHMTLSFAVTWDYRCPFARNVHEHLLNGLAGGADWELRFAPFSLGQVHVAEGETDVWDEPDKDSGILALQAGVIVRDRFPEQ